MRTSSQLLSLGTLTAFALAALGAAPAGAAHAANIVFDFRTPEAEAALAGEAAATITAGGVSLEVEAGALDEQGNFFPGAEHAELAVVLTAPPFSIGEGLGVLSDLFSGSFPEEGLSREEGLVFHFPAGFQATRIIFAGLTLGGPEGGGAFEAVRVFADGAFLLNRKGTPDGIVAIDLPAGLSTLAVTPLLFGTPEIPDLSSDPVFFVATIEGTAGLTVAFDFKPGSCTNPLNTQSQGVLSAAILGSATLNVASIDVSSLRLAGVPVLQAGIRHVGGAGRCGAARPDGFPDLALRFDTQRIVRALRAALGTLRDRQEVALPLEGRLLDGTPFVAEDVALLLVPGKGKKK